MPNSADAVIRADHLSKRFMLQHDRTSSIKDAVLASISRRRRRRVEEFWALRHVSLSIGQGEAVALIGRNGSGKSTLLKLIAGILVPTSGRLDIAPAARIGTMIELGIGFHGDLTGEENVYLNAAIHGLARAAIDDLYPRIVEYSGLANFMDVRLRNYSTGMTMRLAFAVAANLEPDILLVDEVLAVGDDDFQRQCIATMDAVRQRGCTVLFVSHSASAVRSTCERGCLLDAGRLVFDGPVDDALNRYVDLREAPGDDALPGAEARPAPGESMDDRPHRRLMGTGWSTLGPWALDFLRRHGLDADQLFLDLGCGSLPVATAVMPFMALGHYWGIDDDRDALSAGVRVELRNAGIRPEHGHFLVHRHYDLGDVPHAFDVVLAHSLAHRVPAEVFARAIASASRQLTATGQLFVSVPEDLGDHRAALTRLAETLPLAIAEATDAGHPRGEPVYRLTRS